MVAFSRHHGLGARWRNPASGEDKDDLFQHALRQEWKRREEEESSRLLYVAMTRAEHHLVLSFSATSRKPANWDKLVCERLALDPGIPTDQVVEYHEPGRPAVEGADSHHAGCAGAARAPVGLKRNKPQSCSSPYPRSPRSTIATPP